MPIYGYEIIDQPYKLVKKISKTDLIFYKLILNKAKYTFKYKNEKDFIDSIEINKDDSSFILAQFNKNSTFKYSSSDNTYINYMKEYINECNLILHSKKKINLFEEGDNIIDILINQFKNKLFKQNTKYINKKFNDFKERNKDKIIDITGNFEIGTIILMKENKK